MLDDDPAEKQFLMETGAKKLDGGDGQWHPHNVQIKSKTSKVIKAVRNKSQETCYNGMSRFLNMEWRM